MTGATPRQRAAIAISFGVQAVLMAALLGFVTVGSQGQVSASGTAVASEVASPVPSPSPASTAKESAALSVSFWLDDENLTVSLPTTQPAPRVEVPQLSGQGINVTITNPGRTSVPDVWLVLATGTRLSNGTEVPEGGNFADDMATISELPPGSTKLSLTMPLNMSPGVTYNFILTDGGNWHQSMYVIARIVLDATANNA